MSQDLSLDQDPDESDPEFVEIDPTGRYGRVNTSSSFSDFADFSF